MLVILGHGELSVSVGFLWWFVICLFVMKTYLVLCLFVAFCLLALLAAFAVDLFVGFNVYLQVCVLLVAFCVGWFGLLACFFGGRTDGVCLDWCCFVRIALSLFVSD